MNGTLHPPDRAPKARQATFPEAWSGVKKPRAGGPGRGGRWVVSRTEGGRTAQALLRVPALAVEAPRWWRSLAETQRALRRMMRGIPSPSRCSWSVTPICGTPSLGYVIGASADAGFLRAASL
ncbi:hypothetical protein GCM10023082_26340 [Streptomyces tremellae]|uniref:Uncharacterized protein n=1 Tax=Streptomyces tremellae TaxID=1124239 RepID=A0ABP7F0H3_9ACTN